MVQGWFWGTQMLVSFTVGVWKWRATRVLNLCQLKYKLILSLWRLELFIGPRLGSVHNLCHLIDSASLGVRMYLFFRFPPTSMPVVVQVGVDHLDCLASTHSSQVTESHRGQLWDWQDLLFIDTSLTMFPRCSSKTVSKKFLVFLHPNISPNSIDPVQTEA